MTYFLLCCIVPPANSSLFSKLVFQIRSKLVDSLATSFDLQDNEQAQVAMSALITVSQKKTELTPQTQVWIWSSFAPPASTLIGSLNKDVFERRMSTESWLFELFGSDFEQIIGQIVSLTVKTLSNTNLVASRYFKRGKGSIPVDVRY